MPAELARQQLLVCCSSARWAAEVASGRPYGSASLAGMRQRWQSALPSPERRT
jgi:hypothetical protein